MTNELQLFLEDAEEQLTFMENALVDMQEGGVNEDDVGALFRAMHTIKGTAGMFGFDDVVSFTHVAENLLSEVRSQTVELSDNTLGLFLLVRDHVEKLIQIATNNEELDSELKSKNDELLSKLKLLMPGAEPLKSIEAEKDTKTETIIEETDDSKKLWYVGVHLHEDFFSSGMDIINLLSFLGDLGEIESIVPVTKNIPKLDDYNPLSAYIGFHIKLFSESSKDDIEEVFEFNLDDLDLKIEEVEDSKEEKIKEETNSQEAQKNQEEVKVQTKKVQKNETNDEHKKLEKTNFSLRVDSSKVDQLINQISEMVIANAKIAQIADNLDNSDLSESTSVMSDMLEEVRSSVMNIRMVQVGDSFAKFRRIVGDTSKKIGKDINFTINGGETELDKMVVEKISDPLMHMLRNSVDHGIESPEERLAAGKVKEGNVSLSAYPDAGTIVIEIKDDGKGLDKEAILSKAVANGIISENAKLSDKEIYNLIFAAGLSTAKQVSDISGRGVGMDVVKRNIESLRGTVDIDSKKGEGSIFTIRLPLTLAIIDGFLIQSGDTKYIIPLEMIQECIELSQDYKEQMRGNEFINLRDTILPLLDVRDFLSEAESKTQRENIVVVKYGNYSMGLQVDELFGEFQTVIKPLGRVFENVPGISGGTILGSGEIALIFDIPKLMEHKIQNN
jgi:two-component system chemotaxis sensor kinase CheA